MLTLVLLRHAKAEQQKGGEDFARVLTDKGVADATALGRHMASIGIIPDLALVSSAARTKQTFELFESGLGAKITVRYDKELYNAIEGELRDLLRAVDPSVGTLMIVGHNPGIMDVAARLARDGDVTDLGRLRERFPPCAVAVIAFDTDDWRDARASGGRLDLLLMPEEIVRHA